jgi:hypothetical protein|tara:strand:- start:431 stop:619 length:189 start_codon:yes stop_codon:yes gene_type:complete
MSSEYDEQDQAYQDLLEENDRLADYIAEICDIIYYQEPLKIQDRWLKVMTEKGFYTPDVEDD